MGELVNEDRYFQELKEILLDMDEDVFWKWVGSWFNPESILDVIENWTEQDCKEEVEKLKVKKKKTYYNAEATEPIVQDGD